MTQDRRIQGGAKRGQAFSIVVDGDAIPAHPGETIGAAMAAAGLRTFRKTPTGSPRGMYCGMGLCHECLVTVNGDPNQRACRTLAFPDTRVETQDGLGTYDPSPEYVAPTPTLTRIAAPIVVVGAGPAGLSAAVAAAGAGASVIVIDENPRPGGQIYRQLPVEFRVDDSEALGEDYADGQALLRQVDELADRIDIWSDALVWSVFEERQLAVMRGDEVVLLDAERVVIATGAYDRPMPVPGWTLPGVMTAGGAQTMVKARRVRPGERVLLAGTGPLQLVVANQLLDAGAEVVAVAEAAAQFALWRHAPAMLRKLGLVKRGLAYLRRLRRAGVPMLRSHAIAAIEGDGQVERAVLAEVDGDWAPREGTTKAFDVDTVCLGYGFVPHVWMTGLMECGHKYDPLLGGWVPVLDERMQTDKPGVFAAGDGAGVAGVLVAVEEGQLAGLFAAAQLGLVSDADAEAQARPIRKRLESLRKFRRGLDEVSLIRPGLCAQIPDETTICRCEEITAGDVRQAAREGTCNLTDLKKRTRAGMGYCQGATCTPSIAAILNAEFGIAPETITGITPRPPARPIPMSLLLVNPEARRK